MQGVRKVFCVPSIQFCSDLFCLKINETSPHPPPSNILTFSYLMANHRPVPCLICFNIWIRSLHTILLHMMVDYLKLNVFLGSILYNILCSICTIFGSLVSNWSRFHSYNTLSCAINQSHPKESTHWQR